MLDKLFYFHGIIVIMKTEITKDINPINSIGINIKSNFGGLFKMSQENLGNQNRVIQSNGMARDLKELFTKLKRKEYPMREVLMTKPSSYATDYVVLIKVTWINNRIEYVTYCTNGQDLYYGHYFQDLPTAIDDFGKRE